MATWKHEGVLVQQWTLLDGCLHQASPWTGPPGGLPPFATFSSYIPTILYSYCFAALKAGELIQTGIMQV